MNVNVPATAFFLPEPKGQNSGVDFLGLRQTNLDLMASLIPGINNVTAYIRPFSLLAWIYWKFHQLCVVAGIDEANTDDLRQFRERVEVLFTWGARLHDYPIIPGRQAEPPPVDGDGCVSLAFKDWKRVQDSTSLVAALWYGPASKAVTGLGFLMPVPGKAGFFRTIGPGVGMAEALDERLRRDSVRYDRLLDTRSSVKASEADASALWELWRPDAITAEEQEAFRAALHDESALGDYRSLIGKRSSTLALAQLHLSACGHAQSATEVRKGMLLSQRSDGTAYEVPDELREARDNWTIMQVRQLQRLALESLLSWTEVCVLGGMHDTAQIVSAFAREWDDSDYAHRSDDRLSDVLETFDKNFSTIDEFISACRDGSVPSPLEFMETIQTSFAEKGGRYAAHCLCAVLLCASFARCPDQQSPVLRLGGPGRIPLLHLRRRLQSLGGMTIKEAIGYVLESMIISQHFSTAVNRFDGRNQRLRLAIEEEGLIPLVRDRWQPTVTEDRLPMLLSLAAECGIIRHANDGAYVSAR